MRSFKDRDGRVWDLSINLGSLKRIKAATGLDMLDLNVATNSGRTCSGGLSTDPITLADALVRSVVRRWTPAASTTTRLRLLWGEAINDALVAIVNEVGRLFPPAGERGSSGVLHQMLATSRNFVSE